MTSVRIDHAVSSGTFSLDGETFDVDNNVWVIGDRWDCIVIDAPHDLIAIVRLIDGRRVKAVICTHAHDDHVRWAPALGRVVQAPVLLHADDLPLWALTHDTPPEGRLTDGQAFTIAGETVRVLHTPGHAPGAVCLYVPSLNTIFTGDTLFNGGPGATGRSYSDSDVLVASIRAKLFALPDDTVVKTGHGDDTTIGAEKAALATG